MSFRFFWCLAWVLSGTMFSFGLYVTYYMKQDISFCIFLSLAFLIFLTNIKPPQKGT